MGPRIRACFLDWARHGLFDLVVFALENGADGFTPRDGKGWIGVKVLMVNTPQSPSFRGGDTVQMVKTAEALKPLGVEAAITTDPEPIARGFDLAHVFNLRTIDATERQVETLARQGIPIVMSPIYLDVSFAFWASRAVESVFRAPPPSPAELAEGLKHLANRTLQVRGPKGRLFTAHGPNRPTPDYDDRQRAILSHVDYLITNSVLEMDALVKTLRVCDVPFSVAPYGVDPAIFQDPDPEPFVAKYGVRDFVLMVARIEPPKNQLMLCHALRDARFPLVLIGTNLNPEYLGLCQLYGPKDLCVIPHLPPEELRSAYAAARVHALPSLIETCGLTSLEAAVADCALVVSTAGHELEYFCDEAYYCDPVDVASVRKAVEEAYTGLERTQARRDCFRNRTLVSYTWPHAAAKTMAAYVMTLSNA